MARLSTHVLDTARGMPAQGVTVELYRLGPAGREHVTTMVTNPDGRTDEPCLSGDAVAVGTYELVFHAAAYLRAMDVAVTDPPFLDEIIVRFGVADPHANYHVPLLLSPYGYSTYRGS